MDLGKELLGEKKLVATGRKVVTPEDLAIFLMLLRFFTTNMNSDGSLPTARWREMWSALHEAGDIGRPWCHHRYAAMRNFLSGQGLLAWEDQGYVIGAPGSNGQYLPGRAAKWRAARQLMAMLEEVVKIENEEIVDGDADHGKEGDNGEEEGMVSGFRDGSGEQDQKEGEERDILYGRNSDQSSILTPSFRQYRARLELLERLGIDPPTRRPEFHGYIWEHGRTAA